MVNKKYFNIGRKWNVSNDDNDDLPRSLETQNIFQNISFKVITYTCIRHWIDGGEKLPLQYTSVACGFL